MTSAIGSATSGLLAASRRFDAAAGRVARTGTSAADAAGSAPATAGTGGTGDVVTAATDVLSARTEFSLNAAVLRAADDTTRRLLDLRV